MDIGNCVVVSSANSRKRDKWATMLVSQLGVCASTSHKKLARCDPGAGSSTGSGDCSTATGSGGAGGGGATGGALGGGGGTAPGGSAGSTLPPRTRVAGS